MNTNCPLKPDELASLASLLPYASKQQMEQAQVWLTGESQPALWAPHPQNLPQQRAYESPADVLGFGGAGGGGKTDLLLGLAITRHTRSLILRREGKQLRALIDRSRALMQDRGRLNENTGVWRDLPGGRQLELGGVKDPADVFNYKGHPKDFLGIDEADQFSEYMVRYLMGWVRTTDPKQRCRTVLAFNPPATAEGRWLLQFFGPWIDRKHPRPAQDGELRWYATLPDGREIERPDDQPFQAKRPDGVLEVITPRSRSFIQARVTDNPYLMGTGYLAQLQAMPEPLRSQLLYGDMSAGLEDPAQQVIPTGWVEAAQARWRPGPPQGISLDALGVDVARGGGDKTVIASRYGAWWDRLKKYAGRSTPDGPAVAQLVQLALKLNPRALVCIDLDGVGGSPFDWLRRLVPGLRLLGVHGSAKVEATDRSGTLVFANLRAYGYWCLRELLDPANKANVALPPDQELLADLTAPTWKMALRGVKVEAKEQISKRLGRSPDCADAVVYSILLPPGTGPGQGR